MSRSHVFLSGIISIICRVRCNATAHCPNGCSGFVRQGGRGCGGVVGSCGTRRGRVTQLRHVISQFGGGPAGISVTRSGRGTVRRVMGLRTPSHFSAQAFRTGFRPSGRAKGSILLMAGLTVKCSRPLSAIDFSLGGKRGLKVLNKGNLKGSALLGALIKRLTPLTKRCGFKAGIRVNCFSRRVTVCSDQGAILSSF